MELDYFRIMRQFFMKHVSNIKEEHKSYGYLIRNENVCKESLIIIVLPLACLGLSLYLVTGASPYYLGI